MLNKFVEGLESEGVVVISQCLVPVSPYEFPFRSYGRLIKVTLETFFLLRSRIEVIDKKCYGDWDRVIIAGPTWSYHASGPVLDFLDRFGKNVCGGQHVIPFISSRAYWRLHYLGLKWRLKRCGASVVEKPVVFTHPTREPWRTIGLIMQMRGKMVRKENSWFRKKYPGFGHNREQGNVALEKGRELGRTLNESA
ncbi:MAG: hypothetical protein JRC87_01450 [Deltaproteobacteria bacterium]|nr:hypothetical protein [Deltaproteobacteria bacterium]MBW2658256.1 hypothetical protein [Deltaproteobacteria bacterium]